MPKSAVVFDIEFRSRGYSEDDRIYLRESLEEFGAVRLRPLDLPEAGGSFELHVAIQFIGLSIVTGLIEHITGKVFDRISHKLATFYDMRLERDTEPEMSLDVTYDDFELTFRNVNGQDLRKLQESANTVHEALTSKPLSEQRVTRIAIGMICDEKIWRHPSPWGRSKDGDRFWGISTETHRHTTHIYDTQTRLFAQADIMR